MNNSKQSTRSIDIDEQGYWVFGDLRVTDDEVGRRLFENMKWQENTLLTSLEGKEAVVRSFDAPMVAHQVDRPTEGSVWDMMLAHGFQSQFDLETLTVDEWDRFHGLDTRGIPFVMSHAAQATFFNSVDDFDDDAVIVDGKRWVLPPWLNPTVDVESKEFWNSRYQQHETPGWELNEPAPILAKTLPRLKLTKSRILVLGGGSANDAGYFAEQGHWVTMVDFAEEALTRAKAKFGHLERLEFVQADIFDLPKSFKNAFDLVFEHTCYCAINPAKRNDLVKVWNNCLHDKGQLLGVFFAQERRTGPPFGGSEWELRRRLKKHYQFQFWQRHMDSAPSRIGQELLIFATRKS